MELDDFKQAWKTLDHRLERQAAIDLQLLRDARVDRARRGLRPLAWGQALQMVIGALGMLVFAKLVGALNAAGVVWVFALKR